MNLISKMCVLFVAWVIFGGVVEVIQTITWWIKLSRINHPDTDQLGYELLNSFPVGSFDIEKKDGIKDTARKIENKNGESIWFIIFKGCVEWPKMTAIIKLMLDEAYDYAVDKYGLKESKKSAS